MLRLSDKPFRTIQGEGPSAGRPALFLRVQGCSVGCKWCDTKYSWRPEGGTQYDFNQLYKMIDELPHGTIVVITGGEPLEYAQQLEDFLVPYARRGNTSDPRWFEMETSGYMFEPNLATQFDQLTISPKIMPSAEVETNRQLSDEITEKWLDYQTQLGGITLLRWKFVIGSDEDYKVVSQFLLKHKRILSEHIWLMPEGMNPEAMTRCAREVVVPICVERGYSLSLRQHVVMWGARRGV